jgi:hypothetical protein
MMHKNTAFLREMQTLRVCEIPPHLFSSLFFALRLVRKEMKQ